MPASEKRPRLPRTTRTKKNPARKKPAKAKADPQPFGDSEQLPDPFDDLPGLEDSATASPLDIGDDLAPVDIPADDPIPDDPSPQYAEPIIPRRPSLGELRSAGAADNPSGLTCPKCGCKNFRVDYTRNRSSGILRKRFCRQCNHPLVTIERPIFQ